MSNTPKARPTRSRAAARAATPAPAEAAAAPELPPVGRRRGADPNRMNRHLALMGAEKDQTIAGLNAVIDELEEALEAEQEANAGLRAELVAATSGTPGTDS